MSDEEKELELLDDTPLSQVEQIEEAKKLQALLLRTYLRRLKNGSISDTGLAALQRLLAANGWSLDPSQVPKELRGMLTSNVSAEELDEEDGVLPFNRKHA